MFDGCVIRCCSRGKTFHVMYYDVESCKGRNELMSSISMPEEKLNAGVPVSKERDLRNKTLSFWCQRKDILEVKF